MTIFLIAMSVKLTNELLIFFALNLLLNIIMYLLLNFLKHFGLVIKSLLIFAHVDYLQQ